MNARTRTGVAAFRLRLRAQRQEQRMNARTRTGVAAFRLRLRAQRQEQRMNARTRTGAEERRREWNPALRKSGRTRRHRLRRLRLGTEWGRHRVLTTAERRMEWHLRPPGATRSRIRECIWHLLPLHRLRLRAHR